MEAGCGERMGRSLIVHAMLEFALRQSNRNRFTFNHVSGLRGVVVFMFKNDATAEIHSLSLPLLISDFVLLRFRCSSFRRKEGNCSDYRRDGRVIESS